MTIRSAGIIAAGDGTRFKKAGIQTHKPLIPVRGMPLIGHALRNLEDCGIQRVVIIFNESENECVDWARQNFKRLQLEFIVKSTRSSYESFVLVGKKCGEGRHLMMTSDSICEAEEFRKMVSCGEEGSQDIYLGVTQTVFDEKPLWVTMEPKSNQITRLSGESGNCVTAGFYNVPSEIFSLTPETEIASLRFFLSWLKEKNFSMVAVPMQNVFDVDDPKDIEMAEKILK